MSDEVQKSKHVPLRNVSVFGLVVDQVVNRHPDLPGLGVFYGPSGFGKTISAIKAAQHYKAYYLEYKSLWTRKHFFKSLLQEMGIRPEGTIVDMYEKVCAQLSLNKTPLFIDDAQYLFEKKQGEIIKDIVEGSQGTVILIGEEGLPRLISAYERIDNRVLVWGHAECCTVQDCQMLAPVYAEGIAVEDDLLQKVCTAVSGCTRRICNNLLRIREFALQSGLTSVDAKAFTWPIYKGH